MPIFEIVCDDCGRTEELLVIGSNPAMACPSCGSTKTTKLISSTRSMAGQAHSGVLGSGDTACCGSHPGTGSCSGPGSCCGKA